MRKPAEIKSEFAWPQLPEVFQPTKKQIGLFETPDPSKVNTSRAVYFVYELKLVIENFINRSSSEELKKDILAKQQLCEDLKKSWDDFLKLRVEDKTRLGSKSNRKEIRADKIKSAKGLYQSLMRILEKAIFEKLTSYGVTANIEIIQGIQNNLAGIFKEILNQYDKLEEKTLINLTTKIFLNNEVFSKKIDEAITACIPKHQQTEIKLQENSNIFNTQTLLAQLFSDSNSSFVKIMERVKEPSILPGYLALLGFSENFEKNLAHLIYLAKQSSQKDWQEIILRKLGILYQPTFVNYNFQTDRSLFLNFFKADTSANFILFLKSEYQKRLNSLEHHDSINLIKTKKLIPYPIRPIAYGSAEVDQDSFISYEKKIKHLKDNYSNDYYPPLLIDQCGNSLLHYSVLFGDTDLTEFLLNNFPDLTGAQNFNGERPIDFAIRNNDRTMIEILLTHGDDVNEKEAFFKYPDFKFSQKIMLSDKGKYLIKSPLTTLIENPSKENLDLLEFILKKTAQSLDENTKNSLQTLKSSPEISKLLEKYLQPEETKVPEFH